MSADQVTLKDIAKRLNVSPSTVSRALKNNPEIGAATREAVMKLAKEMNYQPNAVALSLRKRKTFTIGVIVPEIIHYFFSSVISGIEDVAYSNGYQVILCQSNEKYDHEVRNIKTLARSQVDGILISYSKETMNFDHIVEIRGKGIPVVCYDRGIESLKIPGVIVDDYGGAFEATDHLVKIGCRDIVHFNGPLHVNIHAERLRGYEKALESHGLKLNKNLVVEADNFKSGYKAIHKLIEQNIKFDGVFTVNDLTAVGAMKAIKSLDLRIPEDVAVVGFGDDSTLSEMVDPSLSSVTQPGFDMGIAATSLLLNMIDHKDIEENELIKLKTKLKIRRSTKRGIKSVSP